MPGVALCKYTVYCVWRRVFWIYFNIGGMCPPTHIVITALSKVYLCIYSKLFVLSYFLFVNQSPYQQGTRFFHLLPRLGITFCFISYPSACPWMLARTLMSACVAKKKNGSQSFFSWLLHRRSSSVTAALRGKELTHLSSQLYSPPTKYKSESKHTSRRMDVSLSLRINLPQIRYSMVHFST